MGGSLFIIMPLVALVRRWCLRELQRQRRPIAPSRITGGWALSRGQLWGLCGYQAFGFCVHAACPFTLAYTGRGMPHSVSAVKERLRGAFPAGDGEGYSSSVGKLLCLRRKITPDS